jgi:hypothetical protein
MDSEPYTAASTASNQLAQRSVINITYIPSRGV